MAVSAYTLREGLRLPRCMCALSLLRRGREGDGDEEGQGGVIGVPLVAFSSTIGAHPVDSQEEDRRRSGNLFPLGKRGGVTGPFG